MLDKKTLDLREEINRQNKESRVEGIVGVYKESDSTLKTINHPPRGEKNKFLSGGVLAVLIFLALALVSTFFYYQDIYQPKKEELGRAWYSVKLVDGEVYYGQVEDTSSDPVVIKNVYYNYDQINEGDKAEAEIGNIRLVKRGQETHGPDGSMNVVRSQVLFMEQLNKDSKVLKAILEYEKR